MRKVFGPLLLGLGAFLLVVGVITVAWAPGQIKKLPLNIDQTTYLDGNAKKLDPATNELVANPVKVQSIARVDSDASDDKTAVWIGTSCVVVDVDDPPDCVDGDDPRLVSADTDIFATDRVSAEAVPDFPGLPDDAVPHEGLVNKWPFDSKKKDYTYWDGTLGAAVPAVFDREETFHGVDCYVYKITITDEPIEIAEGIPGTYSNKGEIWVEPVTGAVQQQTQDQQRYLDDGTTVLDLQVGFTDAQLKSSADDAKSNLSMLHLMMFWMPLIGFIGGALCIVAAILIILRRRRANGTPSTSYEMATSSS